VSETRITVARTIDEVEGLRDAWEALAPERLTADLDYHLTVLRHAPGVVRPHVLLLERDGSPAALAVGRVEDIRLAARIGYTTVLRPRVRALTISQGGLVGVDEASAEPLFTALLGALAEERLHLLRLRLLQVDAPVHQLAKTRPGVLVRQHLRTPVERWRAQIPETFAEYLDARSSKTRSNVNRYGRRLEREFADGVRFQVFRSPDELEELMRDTEAVHVKTYQHAMAAGLKGTELERRLRGMAAERGWFRGFVLYLDDVPSAFWHGVAYRRVFYTGPTGYDPARRDLRLGTYVLARMTEHLCGEVDWMDFGSGDAEYKRHFADERRLEEDVAVFSARPRPIAINLGQTAVRGTAVATRAVLSRTGRLRTARRAWRARLAGSALPGLVS
jgi:CelD/BcsL family acetyltransferase involved in cellulose biosynthesis